MALILKKCQKVSFFSKSALFSLNSGTVSLRVVKKAPKVSSWQPRQDIRLFLVTKKTEVRKSVFLLHFPPESNQHTLGRQTFLGLTSCGLNKHKLTSGRVLMIYTLLLFYTGSKNKGNIIFLNVGKDMGMACMMTSFI